MSKLTPVLILVTTACISLLSSLNVAAKSYKGAEIYSSEAHQYGRYVTRMRMAKGSGLVSTFFTYKNGSEVSGAFWEEIDIEALGKNDAIQWQSNIIQGQPKVTTEAIHTASASLGDAYHTYTLEWTPGYVSWAVDGVEVRRITGGSYVTNLTNPQGMHFNIWASTAEGWVGAFSAAALPAYQFVNWMEYYTYNSDGTFTLSWHDDFNSFDSSRWGKANWTFDGNYVDFDPNNVVVQNGILVLALTTDTATGFSGTAPSDNTASSIAASSKPASSKSASSISSSIAASSKATSSTPASSKPASSSSVASGERCNWYGQTVNLCVTSTSGWGYENNASCVARSTCAGQPAPYGIIGGTASSIAASSTPTSSSQASSKPTSSLAASSKAASSTPTSSTPTSSKASSSLAAGGNCTYILSNEWNNGFTGVIRIKNNGATTINGWSVNWSYSDGSKMTSSYNATVTGSNPYSASNLSWNASIQPGQMVEFGFQGTKGAAAAQVVTVTGSICN